MPFKLPDVDRCCGCVTDLKAAAAIIAVLGIVTSPAVSWAVVRHSYVIRVSCFISTSASRPDIVDINLNNILSFGFGAHAGLGPSCLSPDKINKTVYRVTDGEQSSEFVNTTKYLGWVVLAADSFFLFCSVNFLFMIFKGGDKKAAKLFMISASISMLFSFIYGMLYVSACISIGGAFPVFEFIFSLVDLSIWTIWVHYIAVVRTYIQKHESTIVMEKTKIPFNLFNSIQALVFSVGLLFNSGSFLQRQNYVMGDLVSMIRKADGVKDDDTLHKEI